LAVATTHERRVFSTEELGPLRTLAAEAALALERARSASALEEALERERLVSTIARKVRSELDLDALLRVAVEEIGGALGLARCIVRLGAQGEPTTIGAEATSESVTPLPADVADRLPVSNEALRVRKTIAVADVATEL